MIGFQVGGFNRGFQQGLRISDGGWIPRSPYSFPLLPPRPQIKPAPQPITIRARSTAAAFYGRAFVRLSATVTAKSVAPSIYALAKVEHDSFPITARTHSTRAGAQAMALVKLELAASAHSDSPGSSVLAKVEHDPELQAFQMSVMGILEKGLPSGEGDRELSIDLAQTGDEELDEFIELAAQLAEEDRYD